MADKIEVTPNIQAETASQGDKKDKDGWDKLQILATVAMPLVVLLLGHWLTQSLKQGETKARLVEVAVEVLKTDPKVTEGVPGLRDWAVKVINEYSEQPLPAQSAKGLLTRSLPIKETRDTGCCVSCEGVTVCGRSVTLPCGSCKSSNP
jgi:hypothetical protein